MACFMVRTKPFPEPILTCCESDTKETNFNEIWITKYKQFHLKKDIWIYLLFYLGLNKISIMAQMPFKLTLNSWVIIIFIYLFFKP